MRISTLFRRGSAAGLALAAVLGAAAPVLAAEDAPQVTAPAAVAVDPLAAMAARLDALEARNRALEAQVEALTARAAAPAPKPDPAATKVTLPNARPTIATNDGRFTAAFRGVFQMDAAHYDQRAPGPLATDFRRGSYGDAAEADRARDLNDGTNFRRARLGIEGKAFGDWDYSFLYEFGGTGVEPGGSINQAWMQYSGLKRAKLRVGAYAPPANMDDVTSTSGSLFLERSAVAEMVRGLAAADARAAAGVLAGGDRWTASASVTGATVGQQTFDEQLGVVARATIVPVKTKDTLVHLGVNTSQIINPPASGPDIAPAGASTNLRFRERPENRVDGTRLVDTGNIDADSASVWGLEGALQHGKFHIQGEYFAMDAKRRTGTLSDPKFDGWYLQAGWTLNGPGRKYNVATGAFDAPKVEKPFNPKTGDWGVWEIGARWSDLDLNHHAGSGVPAADAVRGGEQEALTLGVNWSPNNAVRFQGQFQDIKVDRLSPGGTAFGAGALTPPAGAQVGQDLQIWTVRAQYAF